MRRVIRSILAALRAKLEARWDLGALRTRIVSSQRERDLVERALEQGAYTAWDFEPSMDASTRYVRSRADLYALQRRSRLEAATLGDPRLEAEDPSRYGHRGQEDERSGA